MSTARLLAELRGHCRGEVSDAPEVLGTCARDFGGMCARTPAIVLRVADEADVTAALRVAAKHALRVTTRGAGHSQAGQGLGDGLVLDMTRFDRILSVDRDKALIEVQAGATWRKLVDLTFRDRCLPVGLTHALDTTVGGTLSVAGVGAESYRVGPQVDNAAHLDVALLGGDIVRCSSSENRQLFDAVRAGIGQCGVILRAGYPLRDCKPWISMRGFAYRDVASFLRGIDVLAEAPPTGRWLTATLARDPLQPIRWMLLLFVGQEVDTDALGPSQVLPDLHEDFEIRARVLPTWSADGMPGHAFFRVFGGAPDAPGLSALNPWVEHLFSVDRAPAALQALLSCGDGVLGHGRTGVIVVRRGRHPAPLFVVPDGELAIGLGAFATFFSTERSAAHGIMAEYSERMRPLGGKRYLSGYVTETSLADWARHYADVWPDFVHAKAKHDPGRLLNPGFVEWG